MFSFAWLRVEELGQGPCSRKVPFAFAPSTAVIESHTIVAAQMIEGLLILIVPSLSDIGWATATVCLSITDASPAAPPDQITSSDVVGH